MDEIRIKEIFGREWSPELDAEQNIQKLVRELELYRRLGTHVGFFIRKFQRWAEDIPDDLEDVPYDFGS